MGWSVDEVKARMGHKPSSDVIDKYATYLAMDKHKPKKKLFDSSLAKLQKDLEETKQREKLYTLRVDNQKGEIEAMRKAVTELKVKAKALDDRQEYDQIIREMFKNPETFKKAIDVALKQGLPAKLAKRGSQQNDTQP